MKKIFTFILALTLLCAMSVPAFASNPTGGSTDVTYTVADIYTIEIPTAVTITNGSGTQTVGVNGGSIIPADKSLVFKITNAQNKTDSINFRMKNNLDTNVFLEYSITYPAEKTISDFDTAFLSANPSQAYAGKTVTLTYTTATAQVAGSYSDQLTFTVGLVTPEK